MDNTRHLWEAALFDAILTLKTPDECRLFFEDVCTIKEVQSMAQRFAVASQLDAGRNYLEVCCDTGASSATISRVNKCLVYGPGGYRMTLDRLKKAGQEDGTNTEK